MKSRELNIVILPDKKVRQMAIEISRHVGNNHGTFFALNKTNRFPHITIYQASYPAKNVKDLCHALKKIASSAKPFPVHMNNTGLSRWYPAEGFVFWNCEKPANLLSLQKKVLAATNPLREGLVREGIASLDKARLPPYHVRTIKQNASILPGKPPLLFHITLSRISDAGEKITEIPRIKKMSFTADRLCLGQLGPHGTVTKILAEFPFSR